MPFLNSWRGICDRITFDNVFSRRYSLHSFMLVDLAERAFSVFIWCRIPFPPCAPRMSRHLATKIVVGRHAPLMGQIENAHVSKNPCYCRGRAFDGKMHVCRAMQALWKDAIPPWTHVRSTERCTFFGNRKRRRRLDGRKILTQGAAVRVRIPL